VVNGRVVDATNVVTADRAEGEWDTIVFRGDFDLDGTDRIGVQFTNDHYEGRRAGPQPVRGQPSP
jgi:hypothetical protein